MISGYMVFWIDSNGEAKNEYFQDNEMTKALNFMNELRKDDSNQFVTYCSQNANSVGKPGVDTVKDGKLPDGSAYTWMKRRNQ